MRAPRFLIELLALMALAVTDKRAGKEAHHNMGTLPATFHHEDITEYAAGGFAPRSAAKSNPAPVGMIVLWQENADYNFRWDATNKKVLVYVMSTGAEAGAVDVGEVKYLLIYDSE